MSVHLLLKCSGCHDAEITVGPLRKEFHAFNGTGSGWGVYQVADPEALTPEGWIMFDPYTQATYCPDCWAGLLEDFAADDAAREAADAS